MASEVQWLIITGAGLIIAVMGAAFVYALASMLIIRSRPETLDAALDRLDLLERRYERLRQGMQRAGTWKSSYDIESPDTKIS